MKKLLVLMLALCMVFTLCACGGDSDSKKTDDKKTEETKSDNASAATKASEPEKVTEPAKKETVTYTVKVVDENNQPVAGAKLLLTLVGSVEGTTDASGIASYTVVADDYIIQVAEMPNGYKADRMNYYFDEGSREMTIQVKSPAAQVYKYTVKVVDESGAVIEGVCVNFTKDSGTATARSQADGVAAMSSLMADYTITVEAPEGYAEDTTEYKFAEGTYELTITLKAAV